MHNIDIHCHTSLKSFIAKDATTDSWTDFIIKPKVFFDVLSSQSSLSQLQKGNVKLVVLVLGGLERDILSQSFTRIVGRLAGQYNFDLLKKFMSGQISNFEMLEMQKQHFLKTPNIQLINRASEIQNGESPTIQVMLAIEGGYNFYGKNEEGDKVDEETILNHLRQYKKDEKGRIFYITLTHLTRSVMCTHAYAMKIIKNFAAYPVGDGLTEIGRKFIHTAMSKEEGKPILIDIKHMSLKSRLQFYELRRKHYPDIPIIATHMGVTGTSYKKLPVINFKHHVDDGQVWVKYKVTPGLDGTTFNPWTINLFDEEIREILRSDGLIGISLDQRILGYGISRKEFFSPEEFFHDYIKYIDRKPGNESNKALNGMPDLLPMKAKELIQLKYLCNNILHIIKIGQEVKGDKVWDHICLGSDNDGVIKTISFCPSAEDYPKLRKGMERQLTYMGEQTGLDVRHIREKVHKIMYENAYHFIQKNFT